MIKRIDHVALGVRDREAALRFFTEVLGAREVWSEAVPPQGFRWTLLELGDTALVELIDPVGEERRFLHRFLDDRGDGVHHVTVQVDDVEAIRARLEAAGVPSFGLGEPYPGWKELFVHPKQAFGVLIQFAEFDPLDWVQPDRPVPAPYQKLVEARRARAVAEVIKLGDPRLRQRAEAVSDLDAPELTGQIAQLKETLTRLRAALGFGRAIAAPQLGLSSRLVALDLGEGSIVMINPEITARSEETFTLWDDCLSFPDLLVRVRRSTSIDVTFIDEQGERQRWTVLDRSRSELIQHELDHLEGVLAIDHALDRESIVSRSVFEDQRERFESLVDGI